MKTKAKKELINELKKDVYHLNILCGDLNDNFCTLEHQNFIKNLPFSEITTNPAKIITFPKYKEQLDYIILSDNLNCDYQKINATTEKISDHIYLLLQLIIWKVYRVNPFNLSKITMKHICMVIVRIT